MMYMSGNSLQIFSIMMVFMLFKGPIQGLINTNNVFAKFDSETLRGKLLGVKAVYVLMQFVLLALGVWKVNAMGLLPYVYVAILCACLRWILIWFVQDYKVGLARLGIGTATVGNCLLCLWLNRGCSYLRLRQHRRTDIFLPGALFTQASSIAIFDTI
jgi:hypothetical protein